MCWAALHSDGFSDILTHVYVDVKKLKHHNNTFNYRVSDKRLCEPLQWAGADDNGSTDC